MKTRDDLIRERDDSARLTRGLVDAMPGGVVHVTVDGAIQVANQTALDLLGLSYDEATSRITQDWEPETILEDGSPCTVNDYPVTLALTTGEPQSPKTIGVRRPSGDLVWCAFTAQPLRDASGAVSGAVVIFMDITERKQLEDARRRSEATLKSIVDNAPSIIMKTDLGGRISYINQVSAGIEGRVRPEDVVGRTVFDFMNPSDRPMVRGMMRRVVADGTPVAYELRGLDGFDASWYATTIGPVWREREVVELLFVVTDITSAKHAADEREILHEQLERSRRLEAIGRLAGGIAHDFNNLLTVIQGHVDMVAPRVAGTSLEPSVQSISDAAIRAARMTRQLLAFSRDQDLEPRHVQINKVVQGVLEMLTRLLGSSVELEFQGGAEPGLVFMDVIQLERVVVNLATNARDAMPDGGRLLIRTRVALRTVNGSALPHVFLDVVDQGTGIDAETRQRMFEPFFTSKKRGEGSGLGLAIVHGIVTQSGGELEIESTDDGTRVTVVLPLADALVSSASEDEETPPPAACGERVLLVEDAPAVRRITKQILVDAGYQVRDVASAKSILDDDELAAEHFQLLLTDVAMPQMDGPELAQLMIARWPGLKVLFISGYPEDSIADRGLPMDAVGFLPKPFTADGLLRAIRGVLDGSPPSVSGEPGGRVPGEGRPPHRG